MLDTNKLNGKVILMVDDNASNLFVLDALLGHIDNITLVEARNGQDALDKIRSTKNVDLVLLDMMMPILDGYEFCEILRGDSTYRELPVISITASAMPGDKEKCLDVGANDYLSKPYKVEELIEKITLLL